VNKPQIESLLDQWNLAAEYDALAARFNERGRRAKTIDAFLRVYRKADVHRGGLPHLASRDQKEVFSAVTIGTEFKWRITDLRPWVRRFARALDREVPLTRTHNRNPPSDRRIKSARLPSTWVGMGGRPHD
jgi:hypothetical protein